MLLLTAVWSNDWCCCYERTVLSTVLATLLIQARATDCRAVVPLARFLFSVCPPPRARLNRSRSGPSARFQVGDRRIAGSQPSRASEPVRDQIGQRSHPRLYHELRISESTTAHTRIAAYTDPRARQGIGGNAPGRSKDTQDRGERPKRASGEWLKQTQARSGRVPLPVGRSDGRMGGLG